MTKISKTKQPPRNYREEAWSEAMTAFFDRIIQPLPEGGYAEPTADDLTAAIQSMFHCAPKVVVQTVMDRLNDDPTGKKVGE